MRLLLLRHGHAQNPEGGVRDEDRALRPEGEDEARRVGRHLVEVDDVPAMVLASTAVRARQTAELACQEMGFSPSGIHWEADLYGAGSLEVWRMVAGPGAEASPVMVVGHNPGFEALVEALTGPIEAGEGKRFPPGSLARIEIEDPGAEPPQGRLVEVFRTA